jgi:hypothetical protein
MHNGQVGQDAYVIHCLKHKKNGTFVEIGSNHYKYDNNTYLLEKIYNWRGIMVEQNTGFLSEYTKHRSRSCPVLRDATTINFKEKFETCGFPSAIDYLQIDLEVENRSTLTTLENLDSQVMDDYKFAVVTFEHDIYRGDHFNTRQVSRDIFQRRGYVRVFSDVANGVGVQFEDWYVHPDLVDMEYINRIKTDTSLDWIDVMRIIMREYV